MTRCILTGQKAASRDSDKARALPQLDLGHLGNRALLSLQACVNQGQQPCLCQESPWIPNFPNEPAIVWPSVPKSLYHYVILCPNTLSSIDMGGWHKAVPRSLPHAVSPAFCSCSIRL